MHWNVPPDALPGSATLVRVLDRWLNDCTKSCRQNTHIRMHSYQTPLSLRWWGVARKTSINHLAIDYILNIPQIQFHWDMYARCAQFPRCFFRGVQNYPEISYSTSEILAEILKSHKSEILKVSVYPCIFPHSRSSRTHHTPRRVWLVRRLEPELLISN